MLEEFKNYETVSGVKIKTDIHINHDRAIMYYWWEILKILWKWNIPRKEREKLLQEQDVVIGITNDPNMPKWYRHTQSGKCLWLGKWDVVDTKLNNYLWKFDIHISE